MVTTVTVLVYYYTKISLTELVTCHCKGRVSHECYHRHHVRVGVLTTDLSRGETHVCIHCAFINLMKLLNDETLFVLVPASNHFMF